MRTAKYNVSRIHSFRVKKGFWGKTFRLVPGSLEGHTVGSETKESSHNFAIVSVLTIVLLQGSRESFSEAYFICNSFPKTHFTWTAPLRHCVLATVHYIIPCPKYTPSCKNKPSVTLLQEPVLREDRTCFSRDCPCPLGTVYVPYVSQHHY